MLSPLKFEKYRLDLLDQKKLPHQEVWVSCQNSSDVSRSITDMVVRGAPAIGCSACFGVALAFQEVASASQSIETDWRSIDRLCHMLKDARPTAVNLQQAVDWMLTNLNLFRGRKIDGALVEKAWDLAVEYFEADLRSCKLIGEFGLACFHDKDHLNVLTHCNAGALATAGYGTALGVIRSLWAHDLLNKVYVDETRPYLQGTRLTSYELEKDGIPHELLCDNAASFLMSQGKVDAVVTGADRIAANGDTANKIGTLSVAVSAKYYGIPFFIAAPKTTFDLHLSDGSGIPIEIRNSEEVLMSGSEWVGTSSTKVYNPSFDITPVELISGFITDVGVLKPPFNFTD